MVKKLITPIIFLHIVMKVTRKIVVKVAIFYTKNRSESMYSTFFASFYSITLEMIVIIPIFLL
jgi:hypothetical protein